MALQIQVTNIHFGMDGDIEMAYIDGPDVIIRKSVLDENPINVGESVVVKFNSANRIDTITTKSNRVIRDWSLQQQHICNC